MRLAPPSPSIRGKSFIERLEFGKQRGTILVGELRQSSLKTISAGGAGWRLCWKCHGPEGRGDGPSASTLTDSNDQPIRPYNFAAGSRFKCGVTNRDLYKIFMTGLDGTPMPSFADVIKPDDAWDLVHYLRTLQVTHKSPELAVWMGSKEGAEIVNAQTLTGTPTGSGIKQ